MKSSKRWASSGLSRPSTGSGMSTFSLSLPVLVDELADHALGGILHRHHVDQRQVGAAVEGRPMDEIIGPRGLRIDRDLGRLRQRERAESLLALDVLEIEPLGHRFLQRFGEFLVAQDEVGHFLAQLAGQRDVGKPASAWRRSFSSSSRFWKTGKPLSAREMRNVSMKPSRLRQQEKDLSSRAMYSATILATMPCR